MMIQQAEGKRRDRAGDVSREAAAKKKKSRLVLSNLLYPLLVLSRCADRGTALLGFQCSTARETEDFDILFSLPTSLSLFSSLSLS